MILEIYYTSWNNEKCLDFIGPSCNFYFEKSFESIRLFDSLGTLLSNFNVLLQIIELYGKLWQRLEIL